MKRTAINSLVCVTMALLFSSTFVACKARRDKSSLASSSDKTYRFGRDTLELKPLSGTTLNVLKSYKLCHEPSKKCVNPFQFQVDDGFRRLTLEETSFQEYEAFQQAYAQLQTVVESIYSNYSQEYIARDKGLQKLEQDLKSTQLDMDKQIGAIKLQREGAKAKLEARTGFTNGLKARIPSILEAFKKQIIDRPGQLEAIKQEASNSYNNAQGTFSRFAAASQTGITTEQAFTDSIMYSSGPVSTYIHKDDKGNETNYCNCNNTGNLFAFEGTENEIYDYYKKRYGNYPFTRNGQRAYSCEDYILPPPVCRITKRETWSDHMAVLKHQMAALNGPAITPASNQGAPMPAPPELPALPKNPNLWCKCINLKYPEAEGRQFTIQISDKNGLHSCFDIKEDPLKPQSATYGGGCLSSSAQMPRPPAKSAIPKKITAEGNVINDENYSISKTTFDTWDYARQENWLSAGALREYERAVAAQETSAINLARMASERLEKLKLAKQKYDEATSVLAANPDLAAKQLLPKSDVVTILEKNKLDKDSLNLPNDPVSYQDFDNAFKQGVVNLEKELVQIEADIVRFQQNNLAKKAEAQRTLEEKRKEFAKFKKVRNQFMQLFSGKGGSAIPPGPDSKGRIISNIQSEIVPGSDIAPGSEQMKKRMNDYVQVLKEDWAGDPSLVSSETLDFMVSVQEGLQLKFNCAAWSLPGLKDALINKFRLDRSGPCTPISEGDVLVDDYIRRDFYSRSTQLADGTYTHPTWNEVQIKAVEVEDERGNKTGTGYKIESPAFGEAECRLSNDSGIFNCLSSDGSVPYRLGVLSSNGKGNKFHLIKNYENPNNEDLLPKGSVFFFEKI